MDTALEILNPLLFDKAYAYFFPGPTVACDAVSSASWTTSGLLSAAAAHNATAKDASAALSSCVVSSLPRDDIRRQCASILFVAGFGAAAIYFIFAAFSYYLVFDRRLEYHPRFLKNQIRQEILCSLWAIPFIDLFSLPFFLAEVRGHSKLYTHVEEYGWSWIFISTLLYMVFNDFFIYWIHRLEHHPSIYKYVHKPHHKWIVPTPWAAIAFHPLDGFLQSTPYHIFVFICPMQKYLYAVLFILVQLWTIFIHDGDMISGTWSEKFINSPAHHTLHHMYFTCNYGQYFTWADNYFDSHREPRPDLDPIHDALKVMREKGLIDEKGNPIPQKNKSD